MQVRGVGVSYSSADGNSVAALDHIDLEVRAGEVLGILGESGCGKSTLAHTLLRLLPPHAKVETGEIFFQARDLLRLSESELSKIRGRYIALVPQDPVLALNPVMTAGNQIAEVLRAHLPLTPRERKEAVRKLLRSVGFDRPDEIYDAYPNQLSGGQCQRVVIAQAVSCRPMLLIVDEPTSNLDAPLRSEIIGLLSSIRRDHGTAILAISHDPSFFRTFADRVAVMYAGQIVEVGTYAEIFGQPLHPYTHALVAVGRSSKGSPFNTNDRFEAIPGEPPDPARVMTGCSFAPRCSQSFDICSRENPRVMAVPPARQVSCFKYVE